MMVDTPELVQYITWLATERGEVLSPIRLVKFLDLADFYFETEPMKNADPGDHVDFSSSREPEAFEQIRTKKLSKGKIAEGRALIAKMRTIQVECTIAEPRCFEAR
jgi:hypothetical protein